MGEATASPLLSYHNETIAKITNDPRGHLPGNVIRISNVENPIICATVPRWSGNAYLDQ